MKVLFFGDIVGKIGRKAIKEVLPQLKEELKPDLVIANAENSAHGVGVTKKILRELQESGIDFFTSGNHIFKKPEASELLTTTDSVIIRPENYPQEMPGDGYKIVEVGSRSILIINLVGQVFIKEEFTNPFFKIDEILEKVDKDKIDGIIVDFHAEATSEKAAFGWHVDGRVTAVLGTHTHVPTADAKILPQGTAFISDVGMVGAVNSVIGDEVGPVLDSFLTDVNHKIEIPEEGVVDVNAVLLEIDPKTKKATDLRRVDRKIEV